MARINPIGDNILCTDGDFGDQTTRAGLIIKSTIGKEEGVVPRWFKVFAVGPEIDWLQPGQWVYVEYGRWTEGFKIHPQDERLEQDQKIWKVEPKSCLAISDEKPDTLNIKDTPGDVFKRQRD